MGIVHKIEGAGYGGDDESSTEDKDGDPSRATHGTKKLGAKAQPSSKCL